MVIILLIIQLRPQDVIAKLINRAGKAAPGLHLDVIKEGKMVQKLMIDEKKCYFFGRNKQLCDFCIDHQSCSRVHAALVWHKHLFRPFLIDLGSTHGTFLGHIRLESKKPQQIPIDSEIHFGASTRLYIIRERPQPLTGPLQDDKEKRGDDVERGLLGLPETEMELDNLTEFNTAHNRRIASIVERGDGPVVNLLKRKRKSEHVLFNDDDEVINPEDIDPSIGRFRNLVQTAVIPSKRSRLDSSGHSGISLTENITKRLQSFSYTNPLYGDLPAAGAGGVVDTHTIAAKLGLPVPNLAPSVEEDLDMSIAINPAQSLVFAVEETQREPKKKKYAKEAWPGKKPVPSLLV